MYPSVADWAHSRRDSCGFTTLPVRVGPLVVGKWHRLTEVHSTCRANKMTAGVWQPSQPNILKSHYKRIPVHSDKTAILKFEDVQESESLPGDSGFPEFPGTWGTREAPPYRA